MKYLFLLPLALGLSVLANAQTAKYDTNASLPFSPSPNADKLQVTLSNDSLFIVYKNQEIPSASIRLLDSLMRNIPIKERLNVEFDTLNSSDETVRSINTILNRCQCPTIRRRVNKQ